MNLVDAVEVDTTVRQTGETRTYYFNKNNSENVRQLVQALEQAQEINYIEEVSIKSVAITD